MKNVLIALLVVGCYQQASAQAQVKRSNNQPLPIVNFNSKSLPLKLPNAVGGQPDPRFAIPIFESSDVIDNKTSKEATGNEKSVDSIETRGTAASEEPVTKVEKIEKNSSAELRPSLPFNSAKWGSDSEEVQGASSVNSTGTPPKNNYGKMFQ